MTRRILAVTLAMALGAICHLAADTKTVGGYTWTYCINGDTAEIYNSTSASAAISPRPTGAVTIPSSLGGKPVTSIGPYAFNYCSGLTSVTIPNSVTSIGDEAFASCGLTSVTIPDSVTSLGDYAFYECTSLTSVTIPDSVTSIGIYTFYGCSGLTSVHITDIAKWCSISFDDSRANPLYYAHNLYLNGAKVTDLTIPDSVTSIGSYAFSGCSGLTSVTIPDGVTSIGNLAFYYCSGLTSVTIPDSVTSIGDSAFCDCRGLTSVTIPDSVTSIGNGAFEYCSGLTSVTIGSGVTSIGDYAFSGCNAIARVDYWCAPPANIGSANILYRGIQRYPREYGAQWQKIVNINKFNGYLTAAAPNVEIVSSAIRENDPTIMDVVYKVTSSKPTVKVRALAFEDGERSFAKVVRPETFIEGTAANVGDEIAANVEHTLSWQVSSDWQTRLAKLKFEVLACEGELLPMEWMTIPASDTYGKMKFSWNAHLDSQIFDALLWLYADKYPGLTLAGGVLKANDKQVASGTSFETSTRTYSSYDYSTRTYTYTYYQSAPEYIFSQMGYQTLSGEALTYVNDETRLGLSPSGARQYAYKIVEDAQ